MFSFPARTFSHRFHCKAGITRLAIVRFLNRDESFAAMSDRHAGIAGRMTLYSENRAKKITIFLMPYKQKIYNFTEDRSMRIVIRALKILRGIL